jgi:hypothetical protein
MIFKDLDGSFVAHVYVPACGLEFNTIFAKINNGDAGIGSSAVDPYTAYVYDFRFVVEQRAGGVDVMDHKIEVN